MSGKRSRIYRHVLPMLRDVARQHGYALGLHGTTEKDLDLIAVPWIEEAANAETLVEALRVKLTGYTVKPHPEHDRSLRAHGRRSFTIQFGIWDFSATHTTKNLFIDLSVMPLDRKITERLAEKRKSMANRLAEDKEEGTKA